MAGLLVCAQQSLVSYLVCRAADRWRVWGRRVGWPVQPGQPHAVAAVVGGADDEWRLGRCGPDGQQVLLGWFGGGEIVLQVAAAGVGAYPVGAGSSGAEDR